MTTWILSIINGVKIGGIASEYRGDKEKNMKGRGEEVQGKDNLRRTPGAGARERYRSRMQRVKTARQAREEWHKKQEEKRTKKKRQHQALL